MGEHVRNLDLESRSSLEEALASGGLWFGWPEGVSPPAPPTFWGDQFTDRMLSPHRDPAPHASVGVACLHNATVSYQGYFGDENGRLYTSGLHYPQYLNHWIETAERPPGRRPISELSEIAAPGVSVLVHHCHAEVYGHWLVECLPRLMYLRTLPVGPLRFVIESTARPHITSWIRHVAPDAEILSYDPATQYVRCDKLIVPTLAISGRYVLHPRLGPLFDELSPNPTPQRLLYLDRHFPGVYHWILNDDEVRAAAQSFGFEVLYPARLSVQEQIDAFANARVLAADYGSALHNSLFSSPDARVLAFNWVTQIQSRIAQLRGQKVGYQLGVTGEPVVREGYRLDIDQAKRAFEAALKAAQIC